MAEVPAANSPLNDDDDVMMIDDGQDDIMKIDDRQDDIMKIADMKIADDDGDEERGGAAATKVAKKNLNDDDTMKIADNEEGGGGATEKKITDEKDSLSELSRYPILRRTRVWKEADWKDLRSHLGRYPFLQMEFFEKRWIVDKERLRSTPTSELKELDNQLRDVWVKSLKVPRKYRKSFFKTIKEIYY